MQWLKDGYKLASSDIEVDLDKVLDAGHRIAQYIKRTPVMTRSTLDSMAGRTLHFKCELFQKTGTFKVSSREQGWRSGESTRLQPVQPMWAAFKSWSRRLMYSSFLLSSRTNTSNFNSIWTSQTRLNEFVRTTCFVGKQITNNYT